MYRGDVDIDRPFDAPAAGFLHAAPVGEGFGYEFVGGNGGDGLVPVLYLDGGETYLRHLAVHSAARHHYPVAEPYHVVRTELDARHETEDGVLKDEHQDGGESRETAEQDGQAFTRKDADDDERHGAPDDDRDDLRDNLDGFVPDAGHLLVHPVDAAHESRYEQGDGDDYPDVEYPVDGRHVFPLYRREAGAEYDGHNQQGQAVEEALVEQPFAPVLPGGTRYLFDEFREKLLRYHVCQPADKAHHQHGEQYVDDLYEPFVLYAETFEYAAYVHELVR